MLKIVFRKWNIFCSYSTKLAVEIEMISKSINLLLGLLLSLSAYAQLNVVTNELEPIADVQIFNGPEFIGVTDENGFIKLDIESNSLDTIHFYHQQYYAGHVCAKTILNQQAIILRARTNSIGEIVITPPRTNRLKPDLASAINVVTKKQIELFTPQTSADLLNIGNKVYVQKSQQGGGSPMIRGFATSRILLVVDGVRMNTAIFRGGNVQNVLSIDPQSVQSSKVLFGPASQFYGSDAIGGVLSFATKQAPYADSLTHNGNISIRFGSASREGTWHLDYAVSKPRFASFTSLSFSNFGDLRMGSNGPEDYTRPEYVIYRPDRGDTVFSNPNPNNQLYSGYSQLNALQKMRFKLTDVSEITYGIYWSTTSNTPRYDRLILKENSQLVNADWNYGPQKWLMNRLSFLSKKESKLSDVLQFTVAHQFFEESRNDRRLFSNSLRVRTENVNALSANLDLRKALTQTAKVSYGAEIIRNEISSTGERMNIVDGTFTPTSSRYPDGSEWNSAGVYFNVLNKWDEQHTTEGGLRFNAVTASGEFDTSSFPLPVNSFENNNQAITGSVSHSISVKNGGFAFVASTAFKSPNIDDISKVFDSNPGFVIIPNPNLKPEYAYNGEINGNYLFFKRLRFSGSIFYTHLTNAFTPGLTTLNGQDSFLYDGEMSRVQTLQNQDVATVYGSQASVVLSITSKLSFKSSYTFLSSDGSDGEPVRHITPNFGGSSLTYKSRNTTLVLYTQYNERFDFEDFTINEREDEFLYTKDERGLPYSPAWFTINLRGAFPITDKIRGTAAIENILDKRYRPYSSGITAPGRNFILSIRAEI